MRFWKWHALGNSYLVVEERSEPELARRLCDVRYGVGSDGVVEVVAASGAAGGDRDLEPRRLGRRVLGQRQPDRRGLARRAAGTQQVTIGVSGRAYPAAIRDDGTVAMGVGDVEVGETETIELGGERIELTRGVGREPARGRPARRRVATTCSGSGRRSSGTSASPSGRTSSSSRVDGPNELTVLVWERGAGETSASGSSAVAAAAAAVANGWCESPVTVRMPGGEPQGRARRRGPDHARRPGRGDLRGRARA